MYDFKPFTPIGKTNFRDHHKLFGIKPNDRLGHMWVLGKTGSGKSHLLINMALDDIMKEQAICVIDPHGDTITGILERIPAQLKKNVVYFNATNKDKLPPFNPLYNIQPEQRQLVASEMITTFKKLFLDAWGSKLERTLRMCIITLLQYPNGTLLKITALLTDKEFRANVLQHISDPYILTFWSTEFNNNTASAQATAILPILNKVGVLLENDTLRGIFGQQRSISFEYCMNNNKIVLVNLAKGVIGEDVSTVLGSFIITNIQNTAMRRAVIPVEQRKPFYLYIDEAQTFVSNSFANLLPTIRKFGVGLWLANQYIDQIDIETRNAILANAGTIIVFKIGLNDAKIMEKEFYPVFTYDDFIGLPKYHIYIKLMIDGATSKGFSAVTIKTFDCA